MFVQSFEVSNLRELNRMTNVRIVQLLNATGQPYDFTAAGDPRTYADLATPAGLADVARYADGVGVNKNLIVPRDASNRLLPPTSLVRDAHDARLQAGRSFWHPTRPAPLPDRVRERLGG